MFTAASEVYGRVAGWRRRWYSADPSRQRHLSRPVVSVGNLRVGGAGKTPLVAAIAKILRAGGEHPDILSRGYGRRSRGGVIVSDEHHVLVDVEAAGDEPFMLARELTGVPVLVNADRFASGRIAEQRFKTTVHLLDDGFQHLALAREVDLVVADAADLNDRVLPAGRLREPLSAASAADALLTTSTPEDADRLKHATGVRAVFRVARTLGAPFAFIGDRSRRLPRGRVFAVAGIARPERFFTDLAAFGWEVTGQMAFPDHHWYTADDVKRIEHDAVASGAEIVLTTEKDRVRLERHHAERVAMASVPLEVSIEPLFADWLADRLRLKRSAG